MVAALSGTQCSSSSPTKHALAAGCELNSECETPLVCTFARCHAECKTTADCPGGERCVVSTDGSVCELQQETTCVYSTQCPSPLACGVDGQCRNQCESARDCSPGQLCTTSGTCAETTEVDAHGNLKDAPGPEASAGAGGESGASEVTTGGATGLGGTGGAVVEAGASGEAGEAGGNTGGTSGAATAGAGAGGGLGIAGSGGSAGAGPVSCGTATCSDGQLCAGNKCTCVADLAVASDRTASIYRSLVRRVDGTVWVQDASAYRQIMLSAGVPLIASAIAEPQFMNAADLTTADPMLSVGCALASGTVWCFPLVGTLSDSTYLGAGLGSSDSTTLPVQVVTAVAGAALTAVQQIVAGGAT
ncbi:MAG TPA: hypothetical protein VGF76_24440, partial [Polyangiaceae bacterium]